MIHTAMQIGKWRSKSAWGLKVSFEVATHKLNSTDIITCARRS